MSDTSPPARAGRAPRPTSPRSRPWGWALVRGDSMRPGLRPGDRLLVSYRRAVRPGRVVVARLGDGTLAAKRAAERRRPASGTAGWWLLSDDPDVGVDSRHRGPVPEPDVLGVVVARAWPRPRRL
ncbi:S24 family peptidase [Nocardioides salarius]|uniref:S24 family peptidase n=1 Tax=Nocardioides salarius TaxID=374513 RepID=UPI0030FC86B9